jgi:hypothetical protein
MSDIPLRSLRGRKPRYTRAGGYEPVTIEDDARDAHQNESTESTMHNAAARAAAAAATSNSGTKQKGKGRQRHRYMDVDPEEEGLLRDEEYGHSGDEEGEAEAKSLLLHKPAAEEVRSANDFDVCADLRSQRGKRLPSVGKDKSRTIPFRLPGTHHGLVYYTMYYLTQSFLQRSCEINFQPTSSVIRSTMFSPSYPWYSTNSLEFSSIFISCWSLFLNLFLPLRLVRVQNYA